MTTYSNRTIHPLTATRLHPDGSESPHRTVSAGRELFLDLGEIGEWVTFTNGRSRYRTRAIAFFAALGEELP